MRDYHAADHDHQTAYLRDLQQYVETAERRDTMFRPPDFEMIPDEVAIIRQRLLRRNKVCAFVIGFALPIAIGFFAALIILPL